MQNVNFWYFKSRLIALEKDSELVKWTNKIVV